MNAIALARNLGWFSLGLGALELAWPRTLSRRLGVPGGPNLIRAFGAREIVAGALVLAKPWSVAGPSARVAGDALDLAVLGAAIVGTRNRRPATGIAAALVAGVTLLDLACVAGLTGRQVANRRTARRSRVAAT